MSELPPINNAYGVFTTDEYGRFVVLYTDDPYKTIAERVVLDSVIIEKKIKQSIFIYKIEPVDFDQAKMKTALEIVRAR